MNIVEISTYRDGGTIEITTDRGTFCIDRRIGSKTQGKLFFGYPSDSNLIENYSDLLQQMNYTKAKDFCVSTPHA